MSGRAKRTKPSTVRASSTDANAKVVDLMDALKSALEEAGTAYAAGDEAEVAPVDKYGAAVIRRSRDRLAAGQDELIPGDVVARLLSGESRVRVWREHRRMTQGQLARAARVPQANLSLIENGTRTGSVETLQRIAHVLRVTLDDVAPLPEGD
jgi:DNA-binding XRE family transcriptional regulator